MGRQLDLFTHGDVTLEELFEAYSSCRKNKRNTVNAGAFEVDYERNLLKLYEEICNGCYTPGPSLAFIVDRPVKREIFAADFRDRIVHHLIIQKINHLLERKFIYDSYACRVGKGTHFAVQRVDRFIRRCSKNYTKDAWILKLDIKGFFMSISRDLLYQRLSSFLYAKYQEDDLEALLELCRKTVFCSPADHCRIRGKKSDWSGLPRDKSLFYSEPGCGLPIGNLTSQVFANFYLDPLDHFIKHDLGIHNYGRYVDDLVLVHNSRAHLKRMLPEIASFLQDELRLSLNTKKTYLQHYRHGVKYLGTVVKPHRVYIADRTINNLFITVDVHNRITLQHSPSSEERTHFLSSINSYLGLMRHYKSYNIRKTAWAHVSNYWKHSFAPAPGYFYIRQK